MKTILIAFLLFASLFTLPTSTLARQLKGVSLGTRDPNNPTIKCDPGKSYRTCIPAKKPTPPCSPYVRNC
ncbi:hypothetical protein PHAVU_008G139900 [Phaseolus vulgaris]|uniref:Uncharacterized protein n=1 Tax=Phaseolus vulgaris TaxID=3885 RepID=V7B7C7_PHAVU|nr:hypothetical protein PHAVU_008G139900g [Phaseolus vulgaris]ESW12758.1 hypothetical protein PHAVU_008G139900g [Phaseolus vulgaris]